jgi:flagellar motor switch/type III secretory pathway protein FliN
MAMPVELRPPSLDEQLPHIDPAASAAINAWLDARGASVFRLDEMEFRLTWIDPSLVQPQVGIEVCFGTQAVLLALDGFAALNPLLVGDPFALMPVTLRDLVLQRLFAQFIALLPPALAESADVRATHWHKEALPDWDTRLGFTLQRLPAETTSQGIIAAQSPAGLLWLHQKLPADRLSTPAARLALPVSLRIVLGQTTLEPAELRTLDDGDVIWVDTVHPAPDGLETILLAPRGSPAWHCRVQHTTLRVLPLPGAQDANITWAAELLASGWSGETMSAAISTLEVPVTFDLGELSVSVQELERIQPGRLFELPQDVSDATGRG